MQVIRQHYDGVHHRILDPRYGPFPIVNICKSRPLTRSRGSSHTHIANESPSSKGMSDMSRLSLLFS